MKRLSCHFFWAAVLSATLIQAAAAPKIEFENTVYDFGKTSGAETVSGKFKFKNAGDAVLILQPPKAPCGCTVPSLPKHDYAPGESGVLDFSLNLGKSKAVVSKTITVTSNDPQTPDVVLTLKADYSPLFEINPVSLYALVPYDTTFTNYINLTRTDGQPLDIRKVEASQPWIITRLEPGGVPGPSSARVAVEIKNNGEARQLHENIVIHAGDPTNAPLTSIPIYGQIQGELSMSQQRLFWSFSDPAVPGQQSDTFLSRTVSVTSSTGREFELKNLKSTVEGIQLEARKRPDGKAYDIVAKVAKIPPTTTVGQITFETSTKSQPKLEIPITVSVQKTAASAPASPVRIAPVNQPTRVPSPPPLLARPPGQEP